MCQALGGELGWKEHQKKSLTLPVGPVQETAEKVKSWPIRMTRSKGWTNRSSFTQPYEVYVPKSMSRMALLSIHFPPRTLPPPPLVSLPLVPPSLLYSLHTEVTVILSYMLLSCLQL